MTLIIINGVVQHGGVREVTLNMIFSVTYYLELQNAITIFCTSHFLPTKVELIV